MTENITQFPTPASADLTENQQAQTTGRRRNTPPHRSKPPKERPPRDPGFAIWLMNQKGWPLADALRIERKVTRELSADAGADMGGKADV